MLLNLLADTEKLGIANGAIYALIGFVIVFLGITLLILIFTALGAVMKKVNAREKKPKKEKGKPAVQAKAPLPQAVPAAEEGLSPELVAVISAAIMAYYEGTKQKCDFVVRRIKRL